MKYDVSGNFSLPINGMYWPNQGAAVTAQDPNSTVVKELREMKSFLDQAEGESRTKF